MNNTLDNQQVEDGLVSIIMPAYNSSRFIGAAIESVLLQTYGKWELLIVDDCSTDNTVSIIQKYANMDVRIKCFCLSQNSGTSIARNKAIQEAKGEYMAFIDSDDLWYADKLQRQKDFMQQRKIFFSCTSYERIDEQSVSLKEKIICPKTTNYKRLLRGNTIGNSTAMYNVKSLGKFNVPVIRKRNDYALWLKILKKAKDAVGLQDVLVKYRVRGNSLSSNKFGLLKYNWQLYRDIEGLSMARSLFYLGCVCLKKIW